MTAKKISAATGKPGKPTVKKRVMRDGKCLRCGQEWTSRTGDDPKPARCPVCHSREVKWLDLCTEEERNIGVIGNRQAEPENLPQAPDPEPAPEPEPEPMYEPEPDPEYNPEPLLSKMESEPKPKTAPAKKAPARKPKYEPAPEPEEYEEDDFITGRGTWKDYEEHYKKSTGMNPKFFVFVFMGLLLAGGIFFLYRKHKNSSPQVNSEIEEKPAAERPAFTPTRSSIGPLPPLYGGMA